MQDCIQFKYIKYQDYCIKKITRCSLIFNRNKLHVALITVNLIIEQLPFPENI